MNDLIRQILAVPSGGKQVLKLTHAGATKTFIVYFDSEQARGDMGQTVPGMISGDYEVWTSETPEDIHSYREVRRQHASPGKPGGTAQAYAAEQCAKAILNALK